MPRRGSATARASPRCCAEVHGGLAERASPPASSPSPGSPSPASPASCAGRRGRAGRWSATPATSRTRSPPTASPTRCATPSCSPRAVLAGTDAAMAAYEATRDTLSRPLFAATDAMAGLDWSFGEAKALHADLNKAMKAEQEWLAAGAEPFAGRPRAATEPLPGGRSVHDRRASHRQSEGCACNVRPGFRRPALPARLSWDGSELTLVFSATWTWIELCPSMSTGGGRPTGSRCRSSPTRSATAISPTSGQGSLRAARAWAVAPEAEHRFNPTSCCSIPTPGRLRASCAERFALRLPDRQPADGFCRSTSATARGRCRSAGSSTRRIPGGRTGRRAAAGRRPWSTRPTSGA